MSRDSSNQDEMDSVPLGPDAKSVVDLFENGRPLHDHSAPALLVDRNQLVVAANAAALAIAHGLISKTSSRLSKLVGDAFDGVSRP